MSGREMSAEEVLRRLEAGDSAELQLPLVDHRKLLRSAGTLLGWQMTDRDSLDGWVDGRMVLVGDAAHPMYPVGSNGAGTSILGSHALAAAIVGAACGRASHQDMLQVA